MSQNQFICIPVSIDLINQLQHRLRDEGGTGHNYIDVIEDLITSRIEETNPDAPRKMSEGEREYTRAYYCNEYAQYTVDPFSYGLEWKEIFLPYKTELRMRYKGKYYYARVGDDEMFPLDEEVIKAQNSDEDKKPLTPSRFASLVADNTVRNAKRDIQIHRPHDEKWYSYDEVLELQEMMDDWSKSQPVGGWNK